MDAEVYWDGRLIGRLSNIVIEQPYYFGAPEAPPQGAAIADDSHRM
jgi:hypothetical protein